MNGIDRMEQRAHQHIDGQTGIAPLEVDGIPLTERPIDGALLVGGTLKQWLRRLGDEQVPLSALPKRKDRRPAEAKAEDPYATETHWGEVTFRW